MPVGDDYRSKAAELTTRAATEADPVMRRELENLAKGYLRLAEQAERNSLTSIPDEAKSFGEWDVAPDPA
jgi:hypothetical protein